MVCWYWTLPISVGWRWVWGEQFPPNLHGTIDHGLGEKNTQIAANLSSHIYLFCLSVSVSLPAWLAGWLSACLTVCLSLSLYLSISISISLSLYLSLYLSISLSVSLSVCLSLSLCILILIPIPILILILFTSCFFCSEVMELAAHWGPRLPLNELLNPLLDEGRRGLEPGCQMTRHLVVSNGAPPVGEHLGMFRPYRWGYGDRVKTLVPWVNINIPFGNLLHSYWKWP